MTTTLTDQRKQDILSVYRSDLLGSRADAFRQLRHVAVAPGGTEFLSEDQIEDLITTAGASVVEPKRKKPTTRQHKKIKFMVAAMAPLTDIPGYPGCRIDSNFHVFKSDGTEATYSLSRKFWTCARLKNDAGIWDNLSIVRIQELAGLRETYAEKRQRNNPEPLLGDTGKTRKQLLATCNDEAEAMAEDPELFGDGEAEEAE